MIEVSELISIFCDYISSIVALSKVKKDPIILEELPRDVLNKMDINYICQLLESKNIIYPFRENDKNFGRIKTKKSDKWGKIRRELKNKNYNINNFYLGFNLWLCDGYIQREKELNNLIQRENEIIELYKNKDQLSPKYYDYLSEYKILLDSHNIKEQIAWARHFDKYHNSEQKI